MIGWHCVRSSDAIIASQLFAKDSIFTAVASAEDMKVVTIVSDTVTIDFSRVIAAMQTVICFLSLGRLCLGI